MFLHSFSMLSRIFCNSVALAWSKTNRKLVAPFIYLLCSNEWSCTSSPIPIHCRIVAGHPWSWRARQSSTSAFYTFETQNEHKENIQRLFRNEEKCDGFYVRAILVIVFQIDAIDEAFHCFHQSRRILRPDGLVGSIVDSMLNRIKCTLNEF